MLAESPICKITFFAGHQPFGVGFHGFGAEEFTLNAKVFGTRDFALGTASVGGFSVRRLVAQVG